MTQLRDVEQEFRAMYDAGESLKVIGRYFGIGNTTLYRWRDELGLTARAPEGPPKRDRILELARSGFSRKEIADLVGCARDYAKEVLRGERRAIRDVTLDPERTPKQIVSDARLAMLYANENYGCHEVRTRCANATIRPATSPDVRSYIGNASAMCADLA